MFQNMAIDITQASPVEPSHHVAKRASEAGHNSERRKPNRVILWNKQHIMQFWNEYLVKNSKT